MEKAITDNATVLGLELKDYNGLTDKAPVHTALAGKSFANKTGVQQAFTKAVADEKQAEADAVAKEAAESDVQTELAKVVDKELVKNSTIDGSTLSTAYGIDTNKVTLAVEAVQGEADKFKVTLTHKIITTVNDAKTVTITVAQ